MEEKYAAEEGNPAIANSRDIPPVMSCPSIRYVNLILSFVFKYPKTNLKVVLRVQKIEANLTAPSLLATYDNTA